ncbi:uncharacterized protein (DUF2147 family) [Angulomicrobium tetraedrale]|uniref:Uncharacterized protein (DUF2147 family) n=1 Tax=Ancylobacter tetraedralis TaxID=217068 RepID=A0A839Z6D6_9HYPH|nr:DUF2147 domain-containing protein [Ancylobacter tetraedralis]MBB3769916.1 uncharacterized protein (DUF2147 family) [Ancylobacter tetraedralis]
MKRIWHLLGVVLTLLGGVAPVLADTPDDIRGVWMTDDSQAAVELMSCGSSVCGRIVWLKTPVMDGQPLRDMRNPNADARSRPLCGLSIIGGLRPNDDRFENGWVYDPVSGGRYRLSAELRSSGRLAITGFIGVESLGQTREWRRAPSSLGRCSDPQTRQS